MFKGEIHTREDIPRIAAFEVLELSIAAADDIIHIVHAASHDAELKAVAQLLEILWCHIGRQATDSRTRYAIELIACAEADI